MVTGRSLTHELADPLLGTKKGFSGLFLLVGHLLPQCILLGSLVLQLLPQPGQLCLHPGGLFLGSTCLSLTLCDHLWQRTHTQETEGMHA